MFKYEVKLQEAKRAGQELTRFEEMFLWVARESGLKFLDLAGRCYLSMIEETEDPERLEQLKNKVVVATELRETLDETLCKLIDEFREDHLESPFEESS